MSLPEKTTATLRVFGEDLNPDTVSFLLGQQPTKSQQKGDMRIGKVTGQKRIAKTGGWQLSVSDCLDGNINLQIVELLDQLTKYFDVWQGLTAKFQTDIFCGVFMKTGNDGLSLQPSTLHMMGERGLNLELDIYDFTDE